MQATKRLFDEDAYRTEFTATVLACEPQKKGFSVILDQTCFFPEEGGQTADIGMLFVGEERIAVRDAQVDKENVIRHMVRTAIPEGTTVQGKIDWDKRFSDMQQHSGEHILSGLIHSTFGYNNVGFHLSANEVTLDLDGWMTPEQVEDIERRANEVVYRNIEVIAEYPAPEVLATLEYRSKIEIDGPVRIVTFPGVDVCACCAPQVARTGEIGQIKIIRAAKYKSGIRLHILCGARGLADAQRKQKQVEAIGAALSVKQEKTAAAVAKLQEEMTKLKLELAACQKQLAVGKAERIPEGTANVCLFETDMDKTAQRELVNQLTARCTGLCGVFVGSDGSGYRYIVGSAGPDARELNQKLKESCAARGGGSSDMVQGSLQATEEQLREIFAKL
ncbi:MAG: alanine--tRNA ligase-related protein [Eubacteriales bacterium]|nr:alanine--tRNA ligase-related protein [Eubacteriales bacterium]